MENKKGQPTTEAIFRGIQSGKVLELFDKLQYQIAIHGDLTYSCLLYTSDAAVCRCMDTILRDGSEGLFASTGNVPDGIPFTD